MACCLEEKLTMSGVMNTMVSVIQTLFWFVQMVLLLGVYSVINHDLRICFDVVCAVL